MLTISLQLNLSETLGLTDTVDTDAAFTITLPETLGLTDALNTPTAFTISLPETLGLSDAIDRTLTKQVTLSETLALLDVTGITASRQLPLTESLSISALLDTNAHFQNNPPQSVGISDGLTMSIVTPGDETTTILPTNTTTSIVVTQDDTVINLQSNFTVNTIILEDDADEELYLNYSSSVVGSVVPAIETGYDIQFSVPHEDTGAQEEDGIITISNGTSFTGPAGWKGTLSMPTVTQVSIPDEISGLTTTTYSETAAFEIGLGSDTINLSVPARIEFTGDANKGFVTFFVDANDNMTFIDAVCTEDSTSGLGANNECFIEVGDDLIIWTDHFTKFGATKRSSSTASSPSSQSNSAGSGVVGASGASGASVTGGVLGSSLTINEISYDKCNENMARILVSSDADNPPTVKVSTVKSGIVYATLSKVQPYEDLNKSSDVNRYLYELPIASDESFMMISVTEESVTRSSTVHSSVKLLSCEGTTVIVPLPEDELPEVSKDAARIFDTKIQIGNATSIAAAESEFLFVSGQDLRVSAIIDSETLLERVELRSITMGQTDADYTGIKMDVTPLYISNSTYVVSATIPSLWMSEPGITYWLHIVDEDSVHTESVHYNIGAKPSTVSDVKVEVDMPSIKPSGSIVKPQFYIFNEDEPSYGIVSLVVDGEVVSKRSQMFGTGQTQIIFNWNTPKSDGYVEYDIQGVVTLYDGTISTTPMILATHPKTVTVPSDEMPTLQVIQRDDTLLADPALIYASNADSSLRFTVTDPQGQCIIGSTNECLVNESTRGKRGGLESVSYGDQILRVRYSGADNALERFSITSIDPIIGQWKISLESEDGFVQEAHASDDSVVKIKYRYHSETITVFSK
jgi:hypothetical protein